MRVTLPILFFVLIVFAGCSNSSIPNMPSNSDLDNSIPAVISDLPAGTSSTGLFGAYELVIHEDLTAELNPIRSNSIGEDYLVSGIAFFTNTPCSNCLKMVGLGLNPNGNLNLTYSISHPFAKGNPAEPPTAINRLDLDVFDLAMIVEPLEATPETFFLNFEKIYTDICADADGYTFELFDMIEVDAALPYYLVIDETEMDPIPSPTTYNKFEMGSTAEFSTTFVYEPGNTYNFNLYLTMGYGASAAKAQRLTPKYYNPEFNRKRAWKVVAIPPQGGDPPAVGNTWDDENNSDFYSVIIEVYDWQNEAVIWDGTGDYADADPSQIYAESKIDKVRVEVLGMMNDWVTSTLPESGSGVPGDPYIYNLEVANNNLLPAGEYPALVTVIDTRIPGDPYIDTRGYLIDTPDGIILSNWAIPAYQTYQLFTATVVSVSGP